jgi:YbdK family carboxylate-amine ligase
MRPSFSLGIEEEYQTVDPVTRDLRSHIETEMLAQGKMRLQGARQGRDAYLRRRSRHPRLRNIDEAREDIYELRREMIKLAREHNLVLVAGATHPFADWRTQEIYPDPRYHQVVKDLQLVARANLIFGLHVHVGIEDREAAIRIMNSMRYFLPHIMALATNSPFWLGLNTGYKGYRAKVFENFPRTGIPDAFSSYSEFEKLRQPARPHQLHRQRQKDLVGHPPPSLLQHRRSPRLRHPSARRRNRRHRRAHPGHRGLSLQVSTRPTRTSATHWIRAGRTTRCGKGLRENHKGTSPRREARTT